jgi:thiamine-phosphate pyrophosphorylase
LHYAREIAVEVAGEQMVSSEHVLLAILSREGGLRQGLEECGLDFVRLEQCITSQHRPVLTLDEPLQLLEPTDQMDTARILDASANRAREALRVIEDYCRFCLDDRLLSETVKQFRHDLSEATSRLPGRMLLAARDTLGDVGTTLSTSRERHRESLCAVVQANLKRLQEALRSLEEYGKLSDPRLGETFEQLRYRGYTLERAILSGADARHRLAEARLYVLLTGSLCRAGLEWTVQQAAAGGAHIIQLREKDLDDSELLERARQVRRWTRAARVLFILNDRPDIARLAEADGVHVGQEDLPVREARRILGPDALIGVSTHNLSQVHRAVCDGASYIGVGPTFPSRTKQFADFAGLDFVRQATAMTTLPTFVLGGINLRTIKDAVAAGARRVAVSEAVCRAEDPLAVAKALVSELGPLRHEDEPNPSRL